MGFCVIYDWSARLTADAAHTHGLPEVGFTFFLGELAVFAIRLSKM